MPTKNKRRKANLVAKNLDTEVSLPDKPHVKATKRRMDKLQKDYPRCQIIDATELVRKSSFDYITQQSLKTPDQIFVVSAISNKKPIYIFYKNDKKIRVLHATQYDKYFYEEFITGKTDKLPCGICTNDGLLIPCEKCKQAICLKCRNKISGCPYCRHGKIGYDIHEDDAMDDDEFYEWYYEYLTQNNYVSSV